MRGVSLEEISAATRISVRFLEALESEHWAQLPGGIFNRGFIRSVARFLGMDEEGLVAEYALETRERPEIAVWTKEPVRKRRNWFGIVGTLVVLAAIIAGGWYVSQRYGPSIAAWHARHPIFQTVLAKLRHRGASSVTDVPANSSAAAVSSKEQYPKAQDATNENASTQPSGSATNSTLQAIPPQAPEAASAVPQNSGASTSMGAGLAASSKIPAPSPATGQGPMELKVEAGETSTVTVSADGKTVFSGKLDALKALTFHAQRDFTVTASKSNAVLLELNGHTVPPLGPPNQPGKIRLTRDNLKSISGDGY